MHQTPHLPERFDPAPQCLVVATDGVSVKLDLTTPERRQLHHHCLVRHVIAVLLRERQRPTQRRHRRGMVPEALVHLC